MTKRYSALYPGYPPESGEARAGPAVKGLEPDLSLFVLQAMMVPDIALR
jgi:hypothetical protein